VYYSDNSASNTRFVVAKYIRDLHRLEPVNIGVIVWIDGCVSARFLGEETGVDKPARIPKRLMVRDLKTYRRWLQYWRDEMERSSLRGANACVSRESPEFLDALMRVASKRQFVLVDGGFLAGKIDRGDISEVVDDLFAGLVGSEPVESDRQEEDSVLLRKAISMAVRDSGIEKVRGYSARLPLTFSAGEHTLSFTFDSGIYDARPLALFQHALLTRPMSVNSAAFMFSSVRNADLPSYRVDRERCFSLTRLTEPLKDSVSAQQELAKLRAFSTVVDLSEYDWVVEKFRSLTSGLPMKQ
jgi:hypothetical protein